VKRITTLHAPKPGGHYSQGVVHGGLLFVSGQLPIDPRTGEKCAGGVEEQTRQALENVLAIVEAAGSDRSRVLKTTVYITDVALWARVNAVYAEVFGHDRPARAMVPVKHLHHGFDIEVEAVAAVEPVSS
jgi:2-iminobutanoate/2-iminopropanoate deaminase